MEKKNRIILFWTLTILGFLAHSLADALPAYMEFLLDLELDEIVLKPVDAASVNAMVSDLVMR